MSSSSRIIIGLGLDGLGFFGLGVFGDILFKLGLLGIVLLGLGLPGHGHPGFVLLGKGWAKSGPPNPLIWPAEYYFLNNFIAIMLL